MNKNQSKKIVVRFELSMKLSFQAKQQRTVALRVRLKGVSLIFLCVESLLPRLLGGESPALTKMLLIRTKMNHQRLTAPWE
ncbi:hypothetical protein C9446_17305 [Providencia heimbachae]|uniref:hypothetical protein n=1 Tax=Providencia heimbachae TaxID=333962 RepID=UPI0010BE852D|nr:hypothetical protein C9446_17305 [Providencia heimbachae]